MSIRFCVILLALASCSGCTSDRKGKPFDAETLLRQGDSSFSAKNISAALSAYWTVCDNATGISERNAYERLGDLYRRCGLYREASQYYNSAGIHTARLRAKKAYVDALCYQNSPDVLDRSLETLRDIWKKAEVQKDSALLMQTSTYFRTVLNKQFDIEQPDTSFHSICSIMAAERTYSSQVYQASRKVQNVRDERYSFIILLLIFVLSLTSAFFFAFYRGKKRDSMLFMERLSIHHEAEKREISKNTLLPQLQQSNEPEHKLKEALEARLGLIKQLLGIWYSFENNPNTIYKRLERIINDNTLSQSVLTGISEVVNRHYWGITDNLRKNYPLLNPSDIDLCCLICADFSPTEICVLYGTGKVESVYTRRSRIAHKMGLTQPLERFLEQKLLELQKN